MKTSGQSLIELLIALGLTAIFIPALLTGLTASRAGKAQTTQRLAANALLIEAEEAVRSVRERGWRTFAQNGTFHPVVSGSSWSLAAGEEVVDSYTRRIVISDVQRSKNGAIVASGGVVDPSTRRATVTVSWNTPFPSSIDSTTYLTRYLSNATVTQTTQADFNQGTKTGTTVTNTNGGEVVIAAGGRADWCAPSLSIAAVDLPKQGVANAISAIEGKVFAGTGENASGVSFASVSISNTNPPTGTIAGTFNGYKTNDVFGESTFVYLATDTNAKEVVIINIGSTPFTEAGYFDAPGNGSGNSVFVVGNTGYMTSGNKFYTFDLTSRSGSRPKLGSTTLAGTGKKIAVVGSYAYIALDSPTTQLQIVDVSNPSSPSVVGQANVAGKEGASVFVNSAGTRAYVVTESSSTQKEFFIVDVSTKTGNLPTRGSYDTNGMDPKGVTVVTNNKAIVVGNGAEEYQVVDIANESNPARCGGLSVDTGVMGVASVLETDGDAFSYIITGDANAELKIIEGGPGGAFTTSGTFESGTIAFDSSVAFNRFTATVTKPAGTDVTFQIAVADALSGNCSGILFSFVGPDGTPNSFYGERGGPIATNGSCLRYKAFLSTTDPTVTPVLYDITFNYSP